MTNSNDKKQITLAPQKNVKTKFTDPVSQAVLAMHIRRVTDN